MTSLHYAAWEGEWLTLQHLFEHGVCENLDVNAVATTGLTPLHLASWNNDWETTDCFRHLCAQNGKTINPYIPDNGFTPLHLLSWNNYGGTLNYYFNSGIVPLVDHVGRNDLTASDLAAWNHIDVVSRLLHHPDVNLMETHDQSFNALHLLQWKQDNKIIRKELSARENVESGESGSESEQSDDTSRRMCGQHARLGEKSRKSWEDYFDGTESHLLQFSVSRTFQKLRMEDRALTIDPYMPVYRMDWRKGPAEEAVAGRNWPGDWLLLDLMEAILALKPGPDPVVDRLVWFSENSWLSKEDIGRLSRMKVPGVNVGRLSVLGHLCVKKTCSEQVLEFLLRTADGNIFEEFEDHNIPLLHLAGYYSNDEALSVLLRDEKINLLATSSFKLNALHMAVKSRDTRLAQRIYDALLLAIKSVARVAAFKRYLADVSEESASLRESLIIRFLVNGKDKFGMTPLHYAVWEGDESMIDVLLRMKMINVNAVDDNGLTPLHLASCIKQLGAVKKLLQSPNIDTSLPSKDTVPKAFDPQSKRECVRKDAFEEIESHVRQFVLDPEILEQINFMAMRDELQENDWAEGGALERELRGDEIRRIIAKHSETLCWPSDGHGKMTALHCAAWLGHATIVVELMEKISRLPRSRTVSNSVDKYGFSPMHYAVMRGDAGMVEQLLSYSKVKGNIRVQTQYGSTPLRIAYLLADDKYFESLVKAYRDDKDVDERGCDDEYDELVRKAVEEYKLIVGMLEEHSDVKAYIDSLYKERQLFIDAANAILVGAALIASISFAGWLQPPLGYQQYYESRYLLTGSAPPGTYASFASVKQHISVTMFWVFNSLSFFFSVATVMAGASVVLPMRSQSELEEHVQRIRKLHIWTTLFLCLSVVFVLGAFTAAGFASLPTELEYQWVMISTTAFGGSVTIGTLVYYLRRVSILIKQIWRSHPSKGTAKRGPLKQFFLSLVVKLCLKAHLLISSFIWGHLGA